MDRLSSLRVFVEIARTGSFTATAKQLGMSKASVTKHLASLETALGTRLLMRTTRQIGLTDAGVAALASARQILDAFEVMEADVRDSTHCPRGIVRIGTPPSFGAHYLAPLAVSFTQSNPSIQVAILMDDGSANLVAQGLDLSVRIAPAPKDADYVAVPLAKAPQVAVASAAYLEKFGTPTVPADLGRHNCLLHTIKSPTGVWRFDGPDGETAVRVHGTYVSNLGEPLQYGAIHGHGISIHPYYAIDEELRAGRLIPLLPGYAPRSLDVFVVYSSRQALPMRVRRFLDHLREWAATPPSWSAATTALQAPRAAARRARGRSFA
ncbi:LysR family transcriptional regulator [Pigmentiphaga soli]|uniref:LysR family transcriptional regulator n=1 Tax=Pigmentiphaga soli TaxID=1007095 RepID=A0ABP8GLJ6_9BURK